MGRFVVDNLENNFGRSLPQNAYGLHAMHEGRSYQPGARERGGESHPVNNAFQFQELLKRIWSFWVYVAIAKRAE